MDVHYNQLCILEGAKLRLLCVRYILWGLLVVFSGPSLAENQLEANKVYPVEQQGMVKLVATLRGGPAFSNVVWKLYNLKMPGRPLKTIRRHAVSVPLPPGRYRVVAVLNSSIRSRSFVLKPRETREVILAMDK